MERYECEGCSSLITEEEAFIDKFNSVENETVELWWCEDCAVYSETW